FPNELLEGIASHLPLSDIGNMRLGNKFLKEIMARPFARAVARDYTLYARYASMAHFLLLVMRVPFLSLFIEEITLVGEILGSHENESLELWKKLGFKHLGTSHEDCILLGVFARALKKESTSAMGFVHTGQYRIMLGAILLACPNIKVIYSRKLKYGEHIPGWLDESKFKNPKSVKTSFHKDTLYGWWQYDTLHLRCTFRRNVFGMTVLEPGAGPQARFEDDVNAAIAFTGKKIKHIEMPRESYDK
ncbi:hypothetical protein GQ44DRAFT_619862, partial [Phaeosphaeriaceae sp. PMI808]